ALDESAAEHARGSRRRVVERAGLARRDALFTGDEFDFIAAVDRAQPGRLRRPRRAHAHEHLDAVADHAIERAIADPVDVAQHDAIHPQRLAWADHDAAARGLQLHHVERRAGRDAEPLALPDGEIRDTLMVVDRAAVEIDDVAGLHRIRPQAANDVGVTPGRHKTDVLAILLVGDFEIEAPRHFARLRL